jgi:hypothetical protein
MTLYIIGNGFDIHHGYKTSYLDFKNYLQTHSFLVGGIDLANYFNMYDTEMWTDFENELEFIDFEEEVSYFTDDISLEMEDKAFDRAMSRNSALQESFEEASRTMRSVLCTALSDFVCKMTDKNKSPKDHFNNLFKTNDVFLTFNYTKILENIYNIKNSNICHIHGIAYPSLSDKDDIDNTYGDSTIVFGHANTLQNQNSSQEHDYNPFKPTECLKQVNQTLTKNFQISSLVRFIETNSNFDTIEIIGHNLGIVDRKYFEEINNLITHKVIIKYWLYDTVKEKEKKIELEKCFVNHPIIIKYY